MIDYRVEGGGARILREEQVLFETSVALVGVFDARLEDPHFRYSGPAGEPVVVFPCTSVRIEMEGPPPFMADRSMVTYYNPEQIYYRSPVSERGARGHWFAVAPGILEQILGAAGARPPAAGSELFSFASGPSDARGYELQWELVRLASDPAAQTLQIEQRVIELVEHVVRLASRRSGPAAAGRPSRACSLAEEAKELVATSYEEGTSLSRLADELGCSPYHLCRVFRRETGTTLHRYREKLRLRRALLELEGRCGDLTRLALDLGYSSHSHFTAAFRREFGRPPSRVLASALASHSHCHADRGARS